MSKMEFIVFILLFAVVCGLLDARINAKKQRGMK
jgi:hypothetical protein